MSGQAQLFDFGEPPLKRSRVSLKPLRRPIWTENKAKLIERYLYYFVLITKHGTYIDGFAGPQSDTTSDAWSARLVIESEPRWLRQIFLCDSDTQKYKTLEQLKKQQQPRRRKEPKRITKLYLGDFNDVISDILTSGLITETEATFCLLDQRTFECKWRTVDKIAKHKRHGAKIEIFYFLCAWWFGRAFHAVKDQSVLAEWWGRDDWQTFGRMENRQRADKLCNRLKKEYGYGNALSWPIYSRADGGRIAYFMIHASDHEEAPKLMHRAYRRAVMPKETPEQLGFAF